MDSAIGVPMSKAPLVLEKLSAESSQMRTGLARPTHGTRFTLVRKTQWAPFRYGGTVATPDAECELSAEIAESGEVTVHLPLEGPVRERLRLMLRSVWKESEGNPPAMVRRWRERVEVL
jgi:hypothetical protein